MIIPFRKNFTYSLTYIKFEFFKIQIQIQILIKLKIMIHINYNRITTGGTIEGLNYAEKENAPELMKVF